VETIWLSPIYESPMKDFGYDISNFTNVDETFGTLQDFQRMSERAHELGTNLLNDRIICIFTVTQNIKSGAGRSGLLMAQIR
jgi:alpha-glucosidase